MQAPNQAAEHSAERVARVKQRTDARLLGNSNFLGEKKMRLQLLAAPLGDPQEATILTCVFPTVTFGDVRWY